MTTWANTSTTSSTGFGSGATSYTFFFRFGAPPPPVVPPKPQVNAFDVLGVPRGAPLAQCKSAYRKLAKQHHPDLGGDKKKMALINEAWALIRRHYEEKAA